MKPRETLLAEAESTGTTSAGNSPPPSAPAAPAAPAATDAGSAPAPVEGKDGQDDWGGDLSTDDEGNAAPAGKPAKPATKPAPKATPAAPAPAAVVPPTAPAVAAPQPGEAAPPAQPAAAAVPTPPTAPAAQPPAATEAPEAKAAREKAERDASEKKLHDDLVKYYALPDDMAAKLATEPELVLPQLAARLHTAVMQGVRDMLDQGVPQVVQGMMQFQQREAAAKEAFYTRWPNLKQYEKQVLQAGALFGQLNPKATSEERIERIGKIVSESLGIPIAPTPGAPAGAPSAPPAAPPVQSFKPAGGGASGGRPPVSSNEFEAIADAMLSDGD